MSKKKSAVSTSTSGSAQAWAMPYATTGAGAVQDVFNQNQPGLDELTQFSREKVTNPLINDFGMTRQANNNARDYLRGTVNGDYMNGNPYMGRVLSGLNSQVENDANSHFALSGRYGSDAHGNGVGRAIADTDSKLLYQNYSDEMARRDQAAQALQQGGSADIGNLLASMGASAQLPYTGSSNLGNSLGALFSGGTSKSTQYSPNPLWGALGAGLSAAAMAASDRRLKTNIEKVGEFPDGLGIYTWNWRSDPNGEKVKGVIADEVKELRPHAYIENFIGQYAGVNYAAL